MKWQMLLKKMLTEYLGGICNEKNIQYISIFTFINYWIFF